MNSGIYLESTWWSSWKAMISHADFQGNRHTLFIRKINTEWAPWFISGYCFLVKSEISVMKIYQTILDNLGSSMNILITFGWNQSARQLYCSVVPWASTWLGFWCTSWVITLLDAEKLAWSKSESVVQKSRTTKEIWKNHSDWFIHLLQQPNGMTATRLLKLRNQRVRGYFS